MHEAITASQAGANYIGVGCIYPSKTKKLNPAGTILLREIKGHINIPIVAIGGVTTSNINEVLACGVDIIAVSSVILDGPDIAYLTAQLKHSLQ